jgi:hypothetical protein
MRAEIADTHRSSVEEPERLHHHRVRRARSEGGCQQPSHRIEAMNCASATACDDEE